MNHDCRREIEAAVREATAGQAAEIERLQRLVTEQAQQADLAEAEASFWRSEVQRQHADIADLREKLSLVEQAHRELAACHTAGQMQRVREAAGSVQPGSFDLPTTLSHGDIVRYEIKALGEEPVTIDRAEATSGRAPDGEMIGYRFMPESRTVGPAAELKVELEAEPRPRYQRTDDGDGTWTAPGDQWA